MTQTNGLPANDPSIPATVVVIGAGQIGRPLAARLAASGARAVLVSRTRPAIVPDGVEHRGCDAADSEALVAVLGSVGATAVVLAANPAQYDADVWRAQLFPMQRGVVSACERMRVRLVVLECLYMHGPSERITPDSPLDATSRKGRVRIELTNELADAAARGLTVVRFRAPDFYGRGLTSAVVGDEAIRNAERGRLVLALGDADLEHAFSHREDVVDGLAQLALAPEDATLRGEVFVAPAVHLSQRALFDAFAVRARGAGARARVVALSPTLLRVLSWFTRSGRELFEMAYLWSAPYRVDDRAFRARYGVEARTLAEALDA